MKKLAIIITHPIQYYVPLFQLLAKSCDLKVFYTWGQDGADAKYDPSFKQVIAWDLPLLDGYSYEFMHNTAKDQGSHHYKGIINPSLINKINNFNPDAILVYGWAYQSHLKVLRHFKGKIPIWFRGDSNLLDQQKGIKQIVRKIFLKYIYKQVDKAFYVGTANKNYYLEFGLKSTQLIFAPHAIDNQRFAIDRQNEADDLRKQLNINPEDILIIFAGKLEPKKNPEMLLLAFVEMLKESDVRSQMSEDNDITETKNEKDQPSIVSRPPSFDTTKTNNEQPCLPYRQGTTNSLCNPSIGVIKREAKDEKRAKIHLLFVGNGVLEENLKLMVQDRFHATLGMTKCVHFLPFQNQTKMPVVYQACDLFCLPSQGPGETWGLAVNEAMASAKAILVSNKVGCAVDLVVNGNNGHIFESENFDDLIAKLSLLTNDKQKLVKMGQKSTEIIKNWSIEKQSEAMLKELNN